MRTRVDEHDQADPPTGLTASVRPHPLPAFFALAFVITWAPTPFGVFMAAGPLLAALIVTGVVDGRRGFRELGGRLLRWRVGWPWYAAALLIPLTVVLGTGAPDVALGAPASPLRQLEFSSLVLVFAVRLDGFAGVDKTRWTLLYTAGWFAVAIGLFVFDRQFWRDRRPDRSVSGVEAAPLLQPTA